MAVPITPPPITNTSWSMVSSKKKQSPSPSRGRTLLYISKKFLSIYSYSMASETASKVLFMYIEQLFSIIYHLVNTT